MLELNYDNGLVYSTFIRDAHTGRNQKKYFLKNKTCLEENITTFPINYDMHSYIFSTTRDGLKLCLSTSVDSLFYDNLDDEIVFKSNKNNDISEHYMTEIPIMYNKRVSLINLEERKIFASHTFYNKVKSTKSIKVGSHNFYFYLFDTHFLIIRDKFSKVVKLSTDNNLERLEVGNIGNDSFSLMVVDSERTGLFTFNLELSLSKKMFYNISQEATIDEDNTMYFVKDDTMTVITSDKQYRYKSNKNLPNKIFKKFDKVILVDERTQLVFKSIMGNEIDQKGYYLTREIYEPQGFPNYNLKSETVLDSIDVIKVKKVETDKSLYF